MKNRLTFPLFNALICAVFGTLVGYYVGRPALSILLGALGGLSIGLALEFLLGRLGLTHWLYQRRALLTVLLEIPLVLFVVGPYAYVLVEMRPHRHSIRCDSPLSYGAQTYEEVRIPAGDVTLAGWYVPPRETPGAVVVLLHGAGGDRCGTTWHARQLIEAGYGVLLYDQRALGESTGDTTSFGWLDGPDLLAVLDHLVGRPEVDADRIGAVGISGGAHIALNAAYLEPDRMAGLWLDGMESQRIEDFPPAENWGERFATLINACILRMAEFHLGRPAPPSFTYMLAELDHPPMVIVAGELADFERRVSRGYADAAGENVQVWRIEQAGHVGGPSVIPDEYGRRMLEFFESSLGR
jgi:pimeloyl-ACP methyl ester carboxylesterase